MGEQQTTKRRMTATERHEQLVRAAMIAFAERGYAGTTTDQVARIAGVSQPYVIRLFGGKQALFLAAFEATCNRIQKYFREAAAESAELDSLSRAYERVLADRELLLVFLHGFAAGGDPDIGPVVRRRFGEVYQLVRKLTDASVEDVRDFFARGMLLNTLAAMRLFDDDTNDPWVAELVSSCLPNTDQQRRRGSRRSPGI